MLHSLLDSPRHPNRAQGSCHRTSKCDKIQISDKSGIHQEHHAMPWDGIRNTHNRFRIPSTKPSIAMRWQQSSKCTRHQSSTHSPQINQQTIIVGNKATHVSKRMYDRHFVDCPWAVMCPELHAPTLQRFQESRISSQLSEQP